MNDIIIGSHVSFLKDSELYGSVMESVSYGSNTFMIYTGSNQSAERREINHDLTTKEWEAIKEYNIDVNNVIVHAPFIVNLANNKDAHLPPHTIALGHPSAPTPSILYPASNLDW